MSKKIIIADVETSVPCLDEQDLEKKQDKLTAGDGIKIEDNTISAESVLKPYDDIPRQDGTGNAGESGLYARGDHVHPSDSTKQDALSAGDGISISGNTISAERNAGNTYTKSEVNDLVGGIESMRMEKVSELPQTGESNVIYLLEREDGGYDQWVYASGEWVNLGSEDVDLSGYQEKLTAGDNISIEDNVISAAKYTGNAPITVSGTTIAHANSGVAAGAKGDTANQTPAFGGTFKALSGTVNETGHLTAFTEHTVTIPNNAATSSSAGLMSAADKAKLDGITAGAKPYSGTSPITVSGATISHANSGVTAGTYGTNSATALTPAFGGTFSVNGFAVNATGHVTSATSHTVKIPNTAATTSAAGLMTAAMVTKLNGIAAGATKNALDVKLVSFVNPSAVSIAAGAAGTISCTSGTVPSGYTYAGVAAFNTSNVNGMAAYVDQTTIRVKNTASATLSIAAKAATIVRMYIKIA